MSNNRSFYWDLLNNITQHPEGNEIFASMPESLKAFESMALDQNDSQAMDILCRLNAKVQMTPVPELPTVPLLPHSSRGEICLGTSGTAKFFLQLPMLLMHVVIIGISGCRKTSMIYSLILNFITVCSYKLKKSGLWINEYFKLESLKLIPLIKKAGYQPYVITKDNLRLNIYEPPEGTPYSDWIERLLEIFRFSLDLNDPTLYAFRTVLYPLYEQFFKKNIWPVHKETIEAVRNAKDLNPAVQSNLLTKLEGLNQSIGKILNCRKGYSIKQLSENAVIFLWVGLAVEVQNLIVAVLRYELFSYRVNNNLLQSTHPAILVLDDEGHRIYSPANENSYITALTAVQRGCGIAQIIATQDVNISHSVMANAGLKIAGMLGTKKDMDSWGGAMGLDSKQRQWAFFNLRPGMFIAKTAFGDFLQPFQLKAETVNVGQQDVSQEDVLEAKMRVETNFPYSPVEETIAINVIELSDDETALLDCIQGFLAEERIENLSFYYSKCGFDGKRGTIAKNRLVEKGFLTEYRVETGARGSAHCIVKPTSESYSHTGREPVLLRGRGDFVHQYMTSVAFQHYKALGYDVKKECLLDNGCFADLMARNGSEKVAVEVQTSKEHLDENIQKYDATGVSRIEIVCSSGALQRTMEKQYQNLNSGRICFLTVSHYLSRG